MEVKKLVADYPEKNNKKPVVSKHLEDDQGLSNTSKPAKNQSSKTSALKPPLAEERLQKFLARAGVASRRHAEQMIRDGKVFVNGERILTMGTKVRANDRIEIEGRPILQPQAYYYYLLHKPLGVITSTSDPRGRKTVLDILSDLPVRVYPVGRLDYDTTGLLLLTNDGELAYRLTHPSFGVSKTYRAWLKGPIDSKTILNLRQGVLLEDGKTAPAEVNKVKFSAGSKLEVLEITIHEGRNRQIRRMCEAVGFPVINLERIRFGPLADPNLKYGQFRALSESEIQTLYNQVGLMRSTRHEARGPKSEVQSPKFKNNAETGMRSVRREAQSAKVKANKAKSYAPVMSKQRSEF